MRRVDNIDLSRKRVLLRLDLNLPCSNGKILDNTRIIRSIPTIKYLIENNAKIIIISHMGRPKGKYDPNLSLEPVAIEIQKLLNKEIKFCPNIDDASQFIENMKYGEILLLENLRFYKGEEENDIGFALKLKSLADVFINDAFSCSHRRHASIYNIGKLLLSAAGFSMCSEVAALKFLLFIPEKPFVAIVGGSKIENKIPIIKALLNKTDCVIAGGALANTFLKARGVNIGKSVFDRELLDDVESIKNHKKLILPQDFIVKSSSENNKVKFTINDSEDKIFDIGIKTCEQIVSIIKKTKTVVWNGPLGLCETKPFDLSTDFILRAIAYQSYFHSLKSIIGGGNIVAEVQASGLAEFFTYISTAGGAFLEWLEGKTLPGIEVLQYTKGNNNFINGV